LLVAGCGRQDNAPAPGNETTQARPETQAEVPSLEGDWRIGSVGGVPNAAAIGMAASFGNGSAVISTGCVKRAWTYTQKRNVVAFASSPGGSSNCGSAPSAGEETAYAALGEANIVIFSKGGKEASLSGTGGTLTLQRR
jgi:hypothetical protein